MFIILLWCATFVIGVPVEDKNFWSSVGQSELTLKKAVRINQKLAKNVIVFIGDGMGISTVTASRIFNGQIKDSKGETSSLSFESFPYTGLSKTYNTNRQVTDSAAGATAMFTGVKTNQRYLGVDGQALKDQPCNQELMQKSRLSSYMVWGQEKGKSTGIVSTTAITDATPAGTFAHTIERDWECDVEIPTYFRNCTKDIARQLVEDETGKNFKVILGGGRKPFGLTFPSDPKDPLCLRTDGKNLAEIWKNDKTNAVFATTKDDLEKVNAAKTDYLLGLFAPGDLPYVAENATNRPSLPLMTRKAIEILRKNPKGFFLMVEGGNIDHGHHKNYAKLALMETLEFSEAVGEAFKLTSSEDTLIVVTADHSHPFIISGYPKRGTDILGYQNTDKAPYETLTYGNGPGYKFHHGKADFVNCSTCSEEELESMAYIKNQRNNMTRKLNIFDQHFSPFYQNDSSHGGEDVAIYASGPMAHLLTGVHEQNFIAHVISYAAAVGPHEKLRMNDLKSSTDAVRISKFSFVFVVACYLLSM